MTPIGTLERPVNTRRHPHGLALPLLLAAAAPAFAATGAEIARIERGLRQPVALAGQPAASISKPVTAVAS